MATYGTEKALALLRRLPRISLSNIRDSPGANRPGKQRAGQHGGDKHGHGNKGSGQRQNFMRVGYETGNTPFYLRFPYEFPYKNHHLRRQYLPISLLQLQKMIDTGRLDASQPIDITAICNTGLYTLKPDMKQYGFQILEEGADIFKSQVNLEVQWTTEVVIAAVEKCGGVIHTSFYDMFSLWAAINPTRFFRKGVPIPRRMLPPRDAVLYYSDPKTRGYLADPDKVAEERVKLAQKYGYELPDLTCDPLRDMLIERKDPRQVFHGLEPGWVVSLKDKVILKVKDSRIEEYYHS